jgi:hypothetical protein
MLLTYLALNINIWSGNSITAASIITGRISWSIIPALGPVIIAMPIILARTLIITSVITTIAVFIRATVITTVTIVILPSSIAWRAVRGTASQVSRGDKLFCNCISKFVHLIKGLKLAVEICQRS